MYSCGFFGGFFPGTGKFDATFTFPTCGVVGAENPIRRLVGGGVSCKLLFASAGGSDFFFEVGHLAV